MRILTSRLATTLLAVVGMAFSRGDIKAAVESVTIEVAPAPVNYSDREIEVPEFNPSLGVLQSITIELHGTGDLVQAANAFGEKHRQLSPLQDLTLRLETSNDETLLTLHQTANHALPASGHAVNLPAERNRTSDDHNAVTLAGQRTLTSEEDLMQFTGSGFVDLFLSAEIDELERWRRSEGCWFPGGWDVGADITVTYDFVAVPEVSTIFAGCFAVMILFLGRWRRLG
jgi:hypothetical protein